MDIPIESLLFEETENDSYNVLDGKQRTLTLCAFVADQLELSPKIRIKEISGQTLVGMKFSDLTFELQSQINEYELSISVLRPLDAEARATVFFMRNQAVALSKMDLSRVMLGQNAIDALNKLCEHRFMREKIKLTEPARRKHEDMQILLQYIILRFKPDMGFSGAEIMRLCDDIKNEKVSLPLPEINAVMDYMDGAFMEKRQYLKKVHIPIVMYTAQAAIEKEMPHRRAYICAKNSTVNVDSHRLVISVSSRARYFLACKHLAHCHSKQFKERFWADLCTRRTKRLLRTRAYLWQVLAHKVAYLYL